MCMFQPGENSLPTRYDCTSQPTHVGFLKRTVFDEKEALIVVIPWPSSFRDAGLSDLIQMQNVPSCSSNKTNTNRKFWFNTSVYSFSVNFKHGYFWWTPWSIWCTCRSFSQGGQERDRSTDLKQRTERYRVEIEGNESICSRRKVKKCKKRRARRKSHP